MATARLIRYEELDELMALYEQLHPEDPNVHGERLRRLWNDICSDGSLFYIVVEEDGGITAVTDGGDGAVMGGGLVASCTLAVVKNLTRGMRPYGIIENVITRKDMRRRGYGTMALGKAIEIAREKWCYKVMLLSGAKDEGTLRFYENSGFVRGEKTGFIIKLP